MRAGTTQPIPAANAGVLRGCPVESDGLEKPDAAPSEDDSAALGGYRQELKRTLGPFQVFAISFAFISVAVGIFGTYDEVLRTAGPVGIWLWVVVAVGQTLVALVIAQFAARIPLTGSSYQWASRLVNPRVGWWFGLLAFYYLGIAVVAVDSALASQAFMPLVGLDPDERTARVITVAMLLAQAALTIGSTRIVGLINAAAVGVEVIVVGVLVIALSIAVMTTGLGSAANLTSRGMATGSGDYAAFGGGLMLAMIMGLATLVGFDSSANLAEEAKDPYRTVPRAIVGSVLAASVLGLLFLVALTVAIPDIPRITGSGSAVALILREQLGPLMEKVLLVAITFAFFACGMVTMATAARLVFAMARDGRFPAYRLMRSVHPRTRTPIPATLLILVAGIVLLVALPGEAMLQLITASTILPILLYGATVILYLRVRGRLDHRKGAFDLGRFEVPVAIAALVWLAGALIALVAPAAARVPVLIVVGLLLFGGLYFLGLRALDRKSLWSGCERARSCRVAQMLNASPPGARSAGRLGVAVLAGLLLLAMPAVSSADEGGASLYLSGSYGSLAAVPGAPGWSWALVYYHADACLSNAAIGTFSLQSDLGYAVLTYTLEGPVLGGQLALSVVGAAGRAAGSISGGIEDARFGFNDVVPSAALRWNAGVDNYMFYALLEVPSGGYNPARLANFGIGHWGIDAGAGYTYFDAGTGYEFSAVAGLTYNLENPHTHYQNGIDAHLDFGASKFVSESVQVGAVGYYYQQLTPDRGQPAAVGGLQDTHRRDRTSARLPLSRWRHAGLRQPEGLPRVRCRESPRGVERVGDFLDLAQGAVKTAGLHSPNRSFVHRASRAAGKLLSSEFISENLDHVCFFHWNRCPRRRCVCFVVFRCGHLVGGIGTVVQPRGPHAPDTSVQCKWAIHHSRSEYRLADIPFCAARSFQCHRDDPGPGKHEPGSIDRRRTPVAATAASAQLAIQ